MGRNSDQPRQRLSDAQLSAGMSDEDRAFLKARVADPAPEKRIESLTATASYATRTAPDQVRGGIRELNRLFGASVDGDYVNGVAAASNNSGLTWEQQVTSASQYASITGNLEGSTGFKEAFDKWTQLSNGGALAQAQASYTAQRYAQLGSQVQDAMPIAMQGWGTRLATKNGLETQQQMGVWSQLGNAAQAGGRTLNATQWDTLGAYAKAANPAIAGLISSAGAAVAQLGGNGYGVEQAMMGMNISPRYAGAIESAFGGNMQAASYMSWQQGSTGNPMMRMFDQSGQSIFETNGNAAMTAAAGWAASGVSSASFAGPSLSSRYGGAATTNEQRASAMFGSNDKGLISAFLKNGMQGAGAYQRQQSYEGQLASIGVLGAACPCARCVRSGLAG